MLNIKGNPDPFSRRERTEYVRLVKPFDGNISRVGVPFEGGLRKSH